MEEHVSMVPSAVREHHGSACKEMGQVRTSRRVEDIAMSVLYRAHLTFTLPFEPMNDHGDEAIPSEHA